MPDAQEQPENGREAQSHTPGKGPALALLLAGPALSLPSMLVLRSILGTTKMLVYVALVIAMATASGLIYGALFR